MFGSTFSSLLFMILKVICWAINRLTQLFEVFSGLTKVSFRGEDTFLFNIFLNNSTVNEIYWGMAIIGIVLCFGFAIFSSARKMFDLNNTNPMSTGQIVTETLKSVVLILGMNLILTMSITATDVLLRQVNYMFSRSEGLDKPQVMEYTDEQYSAMGRALSTIANYGMNPSYNSRYNINDCFNTIRPELVYLEEQGVFDCNYQSSGVNSWQSALQEVANSADLRYDLKSDVYYEKVVAAMEHVLSIMKNDASFRPLEKFERYSTGSLSDVPLDRIVFLVGTLDAANNRYFNEDPSFDDALRLPYYTGEKSLYDTEDTSSIDVISGDFDISYSRFDYFVSFILGIAVLYNTFVILLNLVARMFNILFLYIIAPPVIAARPLDGGAKTKQWTTAFIIQLLGVFGSIIVMRLLLIFIPIIFDPTLVLIEGNAALNYFGKAIILIGAYAVAKKAGTLLSGILSDTAGMQSAQAGDMSMAAQRTIGTAQRVVGGAVRTAGAAVAGVAGFAAAPLINKVKTPFEQYKKLGAPPSSNSIVRQARDRVSDTASSSVSGNAGGNTGGSGGGRDVSQPPPGGSQMPRGRSQSFSQTSSRPQLDRQPNGQASGSRDQIRNQQGGSLPGSQAKGGRQNQSSNKAGSQPWSPSQAQSFSYSGSGAGGSVQSGSKIRSNSQPGSQSQNFNKPEIGRSEVSGMNQNVQPGPDLQPSGQEIGGNTVVNDLPGSAQNMYAASGYQSDISRQASQPGSQVNEVPRGRSQSFSYSGSGAQSISQPGSQAKGVSQSQNSNKAGSQSWSPSKPQSFSYSGGGTDTSGVTGTSHNIPGSQHFQPSGPETVSKTISNDIPVTERTQNSVPGQTGPGNISTGSTQSATFSQQTQPPQQPRRNAAGPGSNIDNFMRQTYRSYENELNKNNDKQ